MFLLGNLLNTPVLHELGCFSLCCFVPWLTRHIVTAFGKVLQGCLGVLVTSLWRLHIPSSGPIAHFIRTEAQIQTETLPQKDLGSSQTDSSGTLGPEGGQAP